jgi:hypothetical protein
LAKLAEAERFEASHDSQVARPATLPSNSYLSRLTEALQASPRSTNLRIRLGLTAEQRGNLALAESALLEAARFDRQYLPAWTLANYYFRRDDRDSEDQFWLWAKQAALLSYDDDRPLLRLADAMEPNPQVLLRHLDVGPRLGHAYLDYLIGKGHLIEADEVAKYLAKRLNANEIQPDDRARIVDLMERHLDAQQIPAALDLSRLLSLNLDPAGEARITNAAFQHVPSETGFDWHLPACRQAHASWQSGQLRIDTSSDALAFSSNNTHSLTESECAVLKQRVIVRSGKRYRLHLTMTAAGPTGSQNAAAAPLMKWTLGATAGSPDRDASNAGLRKQQESDLHSQRQHTTPSEAETEQTWTFDRISESPSAASQGMVSVWLTLGYRRPNDPAQFPRALILCSVQLEQL